MTTLVMKNLVCGMADILWKEEQDKIFVQLKVSDQTMTIVHGVENIHCNNTHPANKLLHYPQIQGLRVECAEITMQK